ncbi:MAG: hypothetical protein AB7F91_10615 [Parvularculaceae bacterium]
MAAIFDLEDIPKLPLYAQAFLATRMARRAIYHLPAEYLESERRALLETCDALDAFCAIGGASMKKMRPIYDRVNARRGGAAGEAAEALYWAVDAAASAEAANDFPVDQTCIRGVQNAFAAASRADGLSPLQVRTLVAGDFDQLRFACREAGIGFYDALGSQVMGRMAPVWPPDDR